MAVAAVDPRTRRYVNPVRVVWPEPSSAAAVGATRLLTESLGQATVWRPPLCELSLGVADKPDAPSLLLDFGRELHGGVQLTIGPTKGNRPIRIRICFGESVSEAMGAPNQDHAVHDHLIQVPWAGTHEVGNTAFRFVRIELVDAGDWLGLCGVRAVSLMREEPWAGSFACDDERLNTIWKTGAYTVQLCTHEYVWDGPKRDRLVWIGDIHPEAAAISTIWGKHPAVEQSLDFVRDESPPAQGKWANGMPTYSLWWIVTHRDWYWRHGDMEYLRAQREYLLSLLDVLLRCVRADGRDTLPGHFTDWSSARDPAAVAVGSHALMVMALSAAAQLCDVLAEPALAQASRAAAGRMRSFVPPQTHNKQSHALRVLAGLADAAGTNAAILAPDPLAGLSTFYGYYVLQARAQAGDHCGCLDVIRRYWGGMLDLGATTFWEHFDIAWATGNPTRIDEPPVAGRPDVHRDNGDHCYVGHRHSLCHGWAAGPTAWMSEHLLGVRSVSPGFNTVTVQPCLGDLQWAQGSIPTPHGAIRVRHERRSDGTIASDVQLPAGVRRAPSADNGLPSST